MESYFRPTSTHFHTYRVHYHGQRVMYIITVRKDTLSIVALYFFGISNFEAQTIEHAGLAPNALGCGAMHGRNIRWKAQ